MGQNRLFPSGSFNGTPRIVIAGRGSLLIEQHLGILEYTRGRIIARLKEGTVAVLGRDLTIREFGPQDMVVDGQIASLEFKG